MSFEDKIMNSLKKKQKVDITHATQKIRSFFFFKKEARYDFIKAHINQNKSHFKDILNVEFKPVNHVCDKSFLTFGVIIVNDEKEIYLFNNDDESNDTTIKLNLDHFKRYSLFNGQLVAVRGKNLGDNQIIVEGIHCFPSLDTPGSKRDIKCRIKIIQRVTKNMNYDADIVLFVGCDVPKEIKELSEGKSNNTHFLHIHTVEDLDCMGFFPINYKKSTEKFWTGLNNPTWVKIDTKVFSINTFPVLDILSSQENVKNGPAPKNDICGDLLFSKDAIERLCYHLIFQRSYLPIINLKNVEYNIDDLTMKNAPDYYFIRSEKFDPFCRDIGPTKVINIGMGYNWDINIDEKGTKMEQIN